MRKTFNLLDATGVRKKDTFVGTAESTSGQWMSFVWWYGTVKTMTQARTPMGRIFRRGLPGGDYEGALRKSSISVP